VGIAGRENAGSPVGIEKLPPGNVGDLAAQSHAGHTGRQRGVSGLARMFAAAPPCGMPSSGSPGAPPPRVLLIMPEQWPRALLRGALREVGYDALGAPGLSAGLRYRAEAEGRGRVRLIVVDQAALGDPEAAALLAALRRRHGDPPLVLLARAVSATVPAADTADTAWLRILRRPASIADLVGAVQSALPLPPASARPVD
jgi:hypothetical protein